MQYKAVVFDRDLTLTYFNPEKDLWRDRMISEWLGRPFVLQPEAKREAFLRAGSNRWCRTVDEERAFYREVFRQMLISAGVTEQLERRTDVLFGELWCNFDRLLYPETVPVLDYFKSRGYRLGVLSDTRPSLRMTLEQLGIAHYFDSFVCCSIVGAHKPDPILYEIALEELGVSAAECIYIDDHPPAAEGARAAGMASFLLDRTAERRVGWTASCLRDLIDFVENP